jgi:ribonuclease VapC
MLLDSSAIIALILEEPGWQAVRDQIEAAESTAISAATLLETHIVLTNRLGMDALPLIDSFTSEIGAEILPFAESHWRLATEGFLKFGKGRHRAALNFGDCIVYGTARATGFPVLFKGQDFELTDLK